MNKLNHAPVTCRLGGAVILTLFVVSGCAEVRYDTNVKISSIPQRGVSSVAGNHNGATAYYSVGRDEGGKVSLIPQSGVKSSLGQYDNTTAHYTVRPGGEGGQHVTTRSQKNQEKQAYVPIVFEAGAVLFEHDKWDVKAEYFPELDRWVEFLQMNRLMTAEIAGHTDSTGASKYNQQLSEKRAQAVINYLVKKGVAAKRLTARGVGESQPVASNSSEEGRHKNRRVGAEAKY
jgi:outer membrane protein OmpA-like peptidoglycan-associated protein